MFTDLPHSLIILNEISYRENLKPLVPVALP